MTDEIRKKLNGWTVKAIIGGVGAAASLALVMLITTGLGGVLTTIKETHDGVLLLKGRIEAVETSNATAVAAPLMVEHRLMQYIERGEGQIQRLDERVRVIEREHAEFQRKYKDDHAHRQ